MGWLEGIQFGCLNNLAPQFDEMEDYTYTLMRWQAEMPSVVT